MVARLNGGADLIVALKDDDRRLNKSLSFIWDTILPLGHTFVQIRSHICHYGIRIPVVIFCAQSECLSYLLSGVMVKEWCIYDT